MFSISWLELFGYAASIVVAISLMMGSLLKLRWWNLVGAGAFALYGLLIRAYPVAVLNGFIALADVYYLVQMYRRREQFQAIPLERDSAYLQAVLEAHQSEIRRIFPEFRPDTSPSTFGLCVLRNLTPASFLLGTVRDEGTLDIELDFALPPFRDLRPGAFLFQEARSLFTERGFQRLRAQTQDPAHAGYLRRVGFHEREPHTYLLDLQTVP